MTTNLSRESAKIYQFPRGGVGSVESRRAKIKSAADLNSTPFPEVSFGSGWYHDAAIRDSDRGRKI
jgi:hypothetical protein